MTRTVLKKLGKWELAGVLTPGPMLRVLRQVIAFVGMNPARGPRLDFYPFGGKGGKGFTLYQPLTQSFITADVYQEDLEGNPIRQTVVILASCKDYDPVAVGLLLAKLIGPLISD